jgi:hypothetical protein
MIADQNKQRQEDQKSQAEQRNLVDGLELAIYHQQIRRDELSQWGFHSYVISYRIKVRMMEDILDKIQRYNLKPN